MVFRCQHEACCVVVDKKQKLGYGSWRQSGKVWPRQISKKTVASAPLMSALSTNVPIAPSLAKVTDK
jgi:hypothetical protein